VQGANVAFMSLLAVFFAGRVAVGGALLVCATCPQIPRLRRFAQMMCNTAKIIAIFQPAKGNM